MSSDAALLPVNRSAAAARCTRSPAGASALRAAGPSFSPSSQNTDKNALGWGRKRGEFRLAGIGHGNVLSAAAARRYGVAGPACKAGAGMP